LPPLILPLWGGRGGKIEECKKMLKTFHASPYITSMGRGDKIEECKQMLKTFLASTFSLAKINPPQLYIFYI
jgi:hypothetical protein